MIETVVCRRAIRSPARPRGAAWGSEGSHHRQGAAAGAGWGIGACAGLSQLIPVYRTRCWCVHHDVSCSTLSTIGAGENSVTMMVLSLCTQGPALLSGNKIMRAVRDQGFKVMDVNALRSWKVDIMIHEDSVVVMHTKQEQDMSAYEKRVTYPDLGKQTRRFELSWWCRFNVQRDPVQLVAAHGTVESIQFSDQMPPDLKIELSALLEGKFGTVEGDPVTRTYD